MTRIQHDVALAPFSTIGLGGRCFAMITIEKEQDLPAAFAFAKEQQKPWRVLAGGSNILIQDQKIDAVILKMAISGITTTDQGEDRLYTVGAGEIWDQFVARTTADGFQGIECLSGIPGSVGATPIQNVGAYGQEVSQTIQAVRAYDTWKDRVVTLSHRECHFSYRDSTFKGKNRGRYVVLGVSFLLKGIVKPQLRYPELERAVKAAVNGKTIKIIGAEWLQLVRQQTIAIRHSKGMVITADDPESRSLGSFFTNPIVSAETLAVVKSKATAMGYELTAYPEGEGFKLSAAWLIEKSGIAKGIEQNGVGVSKKHVLALVNRGGTTAAILALAEQIRAKVHETFSVVLQQEPENW